MMKDGFHIKMGNLRANVFFLLSGLAVLGLFLSLSLISYALTAVGLLMLLLIAGSDRHIPTTRSLHEMKTFSVLLTFQLLATGYRHFNTTWMLSSRLQSLAESLGTTIQTLLMVTGVLGCAAAIYAMNVMACCIVSLAACLMKKTLPVTNSQVMAVNMRRNCFFPASAIFFFCLNATWIIGYEKSIQIAFLAALIISSQIPSMLDYIREATLPVLLVALCTAIGICLGDGSSFYTYWEMPQFLLELNQLLPVPVGGGALRVMSVVFAIMGLPYVFLWVLYFWRQLLRIQERSGLFKGIRGREWFFYAVLLSLSLGYMCFAFARTDAFYGTSFSYDIIYTSDSPSLMKENAFMLLTQTENDLRQPLFAVFSAPFVGIPHLLGRLFTPGVQAMLINSVQVVLMFLANLMLSRMMRLDERKRVCFMLLLTCTYTQMLFTVMIEQYLISYFWLIFCVYQIAEKDQPNLMAFWGSGGTLLTSMVLLPWMSARNPWRQPEKWLADIIRNSLGFILLMLTFGRFDIIYHLGERISFLNGFIDKKVSLLYKLEQYTAFVHNCFFTPNAGAALNMDGHISWQLNQMGGLNVAGILIFILVLCSILWNRKKISALLAGGWVAFSVIILFVLGWGTLENGLILYSLYFGWAFFVLLFQLMERIEEKLNIRFLIPGISACAAGMLLIVNIPGIAEMLRFAIAHYPA